MTAATMGAMIKPSTSNRSSEPAPPALRVSDSRPSSWSTMWAISPAISEAAIVTRIVRSTCRLMSPLRAGGTPIRRAD